MMQSVRIAGDTGYKILLQQKCSGVLDSLTVFSQDATACKLQMAAHIQPGCDDLRLFAYREIPLRMGDQGDISKRQDALQGILKKIRTCIYGKFRKQIAAAVDRRYLFLTQQLGQLLLDCISMVGENKPMRNTMKLLTMYYPTSQM